MGGSLSQKQKQSEQKNRNNHQKFIGFINQKFWITDLVYGFYQHLMNHKQASEHQVQAKQKIILQFLNIIQKTSSWKSKQPLIDKWGQEIQGMFYEETRQGRPQLFEKSISNLPSQYKNFPAFLKPQALIFQWQTIPKHPHNRQSNLPQIISHIRNIYSQFHTKSLLCLPGNVLHYKNLSPKQLQQINWFSKSKIIQDYYYGKKDAEKNLSGIFFSFYRYRSHQKQFKMKVPLFKDKNTNKKQILKTQPNADYITMDSPVFAMYHSDLQTTFSSYNLDFICYLHDQFHILGPLMFAWSGSTVIHNYKIGTTDNHFGLIQQMFNDQRTKQQLNPKNPKYLPTGRYSPSSLYLWQGQFNKSEYSNIQLNIDPKIQQFIRKQISQKNIQISENLIKHLGYMMKRDTGIIKAGFKQISNQQLAQFQTFNKQIMPYVRLKNPIGGEGGWRLEIRCKNTQLTADYTAALMIMDYLFAKLFQKRRDINLYIPISLTHENYERGCEFDAVKTQKYYFRTNIFEVGQPIIQQLSIKEILFGFGNNFTGIFNLIKNQCTEIFENKENSKIINNLQQFFKELIEGKRLTVAQWMRKFIDGHPLYHHNSIISYGLTESLISEMIMISMQTKKDEFLSPVFQ